MRKLFLVSFIGLLFAGLIARLYLIWQLPLWHDEAYSIFAVQRSWLDIITGKADPVHLPGYYLFLKIWLWPSDHLFWARLSSLLAFFANCFLFYFLGKRLKNKAFALILVFLYVFSGYFVIFDWQVRMYTPTLTLILLSLWFLVNKNWYLFVLINTIGVYFDYAFWWYFLPILFFYCLKLLNSIIFKRVSQSKEKLTLLSLSFSLIIFLPWMPFFIFHYPSGISGIAWTSRQMHPLFFIPFFLGVHNNYFMLPFLIAAVCLGLYLFFTKWGQKTLEIVLFCCFFSLITSLLYSFFFTPLFHLRSLQISALGFGLLTAFSLYFFWKEYRFLFSITALIIVINFLLVLKLLFLQPGFLLIQPFPWKGLKSKINSQVKTIIINKVKTLPTPLLLWGLKYSLEGKEELFAKPISYTQISAQGFAKPKNCRLTVSSLLDIYECK